MADRVLVIGLDMGDLALIEKWSLEGFLPTFRSLLAEGMWGELKTTADALHTSSWPTIFTGTLPGKHGVYYPYQPRPGQQQPSILSRDNMAHRRSGRSWMGRANAASSWTRPKLFQQ